MPAPGRRQAVQLVGALVVTVPGVLLRAAGTALDPKPGALVFGIAVVGAAFVLSWSAEVAEIDIGAGLALALIALIAVLPEYAVDFVFAWKAGDDPERYGPLALANMTGGNQMLIGVGWPLVVGLAVWRMRGDRRPTGTAPGRGAAVQLERSHSVELAFLALATAYGLTLPLRNRLTLLDTAVLVALYGGYVFRIARMPSRGAELIGPGELLAGLRPRRRRAAVVALLVWAAGVVIACAEPFADALIDTGEELGVSTFLLVKWIAPLASEAPELLVAALFALRLHASSGLGTLVSAKVNQWTLLVGTLPLVFAVSSSGLGGLPLGSHQRAELFVTAAQSTLALAYLAGRSLRDREAAALLGLFALQFAAGTLLPAGIRTESRIVVGGVYLALAATVLLRRRRALGVTLRDGLVTPVTALTERIGATKRPSATQHPEWS